MYLMRGLPRSGKSTVAKDLSIAHSAPIVSRDSIRLAIHGKPFIQEYEHAVTQAVELMIRSLVFAGHRAIILDECNINLKKSIGSILSIFDKIEDISCDVIEILVDTSVEECIERAIECDQAYLVPVIQDMYENWSD